MTAPTAFVPSAIADQLPANLQDPDGFYEALLVAHEGLSREACEALNARLVLTLANAIGQQDTLLQCLRVAQSAK